ncbi:MAG TPA: DUF6541 family protein [Ktedonobacteraceae bacterium]
MSPRLPAAGQLIILLMVALALLWPAPFTTNQLFAVWDGSDLITSHWPTALLIQRTFAQDHQLAFWNPYFVGGLPLAANPLAAFFYPPTHLVHFLPLRDFYMVLVTGHLLLAGVGMLLLARRTFGLSRFSALVAAVSYMATPKMLAHLGAGHITMVQTVAWYPWLALACWATVRDPRRWGVLLGLCIALTLLAGHPQMAYYGFLMIAVMAIWMLVKRWRREGWKAQLAPVAGLVAAVVIGLLLAAMYLVPLVELISVSTRQASINVGDVFPLSRFLRALISQPPPGSGWELMVAPGRSVLVLALLAMVIRWRKTWPLALGIVLVAGLTLGNASPFYYIVARLLPELNSFRGAARIWFIALVQIALLAGVGADVLLEGIRRAINFLLNKGQRGMRPLMAAAGSLMVLIVAFSLIVMDVGYTRVNDDSMATTPSPLARVAAQLAGSEKVYSVQQNILQASAVELSVHLADGQDPLLIESYVAYMQQAGGYHESGYNLRIPYDAPGVQPHARLLGLMDVRIVVSRRPLSDPQFVLLKQVDGVLIYRNTADAGPAYLVSADARGNPPSLDQVQPLNTSVRELLQTDEQSTFAFSTSTSAYLVLATTAFPGWTASLDGQVVPIQLIAGVLPAIKVGPGAHTLSYSYHPSSVRTGALFSVIGLLAALAWWILGRLWPARRRKSRRPPTDGAEEPQKVLVQGAAS